MPGPVLLTASTDVDRLLATGSAAAAEFEKVGPSTASTFCDVISDRMTTADCADCESSLSMTRCTSAPLIPPAALIWLTASWAPLTCWGP